MKFSKHLSLFAALAAATALTPLVAQTVADESAPEARLDIPDGQTLFGKNDPNVRRATAQVNGEIITGTDIDHRLALIVAANNNKLPPEEVERFRAQILTNLIDETLQIQEAAANEIEVKDEEVNQYFERVAQQNFGRPASEVEKYLTSIGSSVATLKRQIKGELSWSRLLSRNVRPSANVSDDEVNAIIERIQATKGTTEYRLGEDHGAASSGRQFRRLCAAVFGGFDGFGRRRLGLAVASAIAAVAGAGSRGHDGQRNRGRSVAGRYLNPALD
jgi:peptidyl-prolyl cis-trans isomerase SurA